MGNTTASEFEQHLGCGIIYQRGGHPQRAIAALEKAASPEAPLECAAQAHAHLSVVYCSLSQWDASLHHAKLSEEAARRAKSISLLCEALNVEGACYFHQGRLDAAEATFRKILGHVEDADMKSQGLALSNLGAVVADRNDFVLAQKYFQAAHECFVVAEYIPGIIRSLHNLGGVKLDLGNINEALADFSRAKQAAENAGDMEIVGLATANIAEALAKGGDPDCAERLVGQAVGQFTGANNLYRRCYSLGVLAGIAELSNNTAEAIRTYEVAVKEAKKGGFELLQKRFTERLFALTFRSQYSFTNPLLTG